MLFMAIDISGAVFSLLSLVFRRQFDAVASATYISVIVSLFFFFFFFFFSPLSVFPPLRL
jgi:hypothetical protein